MTPLPKFLFLLLFFVQFPVTSSGQIPPACVAALQAHQQQRFEDAIPQYRQCLTEQPGNFQARSNLGAALSQLGRFQEAIAAYNKALETAPPAAANALRRNLALGFYKSGQIPEAETELLRVRETEPGDRQTLLLLADCYLRGGEPEKTVALLQNVADSDDQAVDYLLGTALIRSGDTAKGKIVIDRILRRSDSAEVHLLLGAALLEGHDYPAAVAELSKALTINPAVASANSYYGQALLATGDANGAVEAFHKELAANANDFEANLELGQILAARQKPGEALPLLKRATLIRPASLAAHASLAEAYFKIGRGAEAAGERQWLAAHGYRQEAARPGDGSQSDGPQKGSFAPDFSLARHASEGHVALSRYRGKSPVLLVFASYSCPQFRAQVEKLNSFYERFGQRVPFLLVYIREAHAGASWESSINQREGIQVADAKTEEQRQANTALCLRKLKIRFSAAVDDMNGAAEKAYAAWPSRVFLVDARGRIDFETRLDEQAFDAAALEKALQRVAATGAAKK